MTRATYNATDNTLTELPDLDSPPDKPIENNYWGNRAAFYRDMINWQRVMDDYNANALKITAVCRTIPCSPECRGVFEVGKTYEEGKDYEVREISKYQRPVGAKNLRVTSHKNKLDLPEPLRSTLAAYPIITNAQQPCFWVKASDRLPKYLGEPRIVKIDGLPSAGNFENDENGNLCFYVTWGHEWVVTKDKFSGIEWLDEPAYPLPVKSEDGLKDEIDTVLVAYIDKAGRDEAVNTIVRILLEKYSLTKR